MAVSDSLVDRQEQPADPSWNYKLIALSNTTLGILMVTINQ
jgi:hypothetical protein